MRIKLGTLQKHSLEKYPLEIKICYAFFAILRVPKLVLPVPETKNGDHSYRPNYHSKPRKNHILAADLLVRHKVGEGGWWAAKLQKIEPAGTLQGCAMRARSVRTGKLNQCLSTHH